MTTPRERVLMLWFYARDGASLRVETRYDHDAREYVGILTDADGRENLQRFRNAPAFRDWLVSLDTSLTEERWVQNGPPHVLTDGEPSV